MRLLVFFILYFLFSIPSSAGQDIAAVKKEMQKCKIEALPAFQTFVSEKLNGSDQCKSAEECIFLPAGEGYTLNKDSALKIYPCISAAVSAYTNYCLKKFPGRNFDFKDKIFFKEKSFPNRFTCESHKCVAHFDANSRRLPPFLPRKPFSHACDKEAFAVYSK